MSTDGFQFLKGAPSCPLAGAARKGYMRVDPNFVKNNSGNIFDHEVATLGTILSQISGLKDHLFPFYRPLSDSMLGSGATFFGQLSKMEAF